MYLYSKGPRANKKLFEGAAIAMQGQNNLEEEMETEQQTRISMQTFHQTHEAQGRKGWVTQEKERDTP
jgi:hypothetical protein